MRERLTPDERQCLLRLARAALAESLRSDGSLEEELERSEITPPLREGRGAFVSLKKRTDRGSETLRGCIGHMVARGPLYRTVIEMARKAAFEDPRFSPMLAEELADVRIEISALTPMQPIADVEEVEVGRHGVQVKKGASSAVFLPQVAGEHGWDRETLLRQLSLKAGLAADSWKRAELSIFEAEVFGEPRG